MNIVTCDSELAGEHRLFGRRDCEKSFVITSYLVANCKSQTACIIFHKSVFKD